VVEDTEDGEVEFIIGGDVVFIMDGEVMFMIDGDVTFIMDGEVVFIIAGEVAFIIDGEVAFIITGEVVFIIGGVGVVPFTISGILLHIYFIFDKAEVTFLSPLTVPFSHVFVLLTTHVISTSIILQLDVEDWQGCNIPSTSILLASSRHCLALSTSQPFGFSHCSPV